MSTRSGRRRLPGLGAGPRTARVADVLRRESVGGALLLVAAFAALVWANSPWSGGYFWLRDLEVGPQALHLRLTLGEWAADGLLAIFFFVAGLELKREFVTGELSDPARAVVPVAAAVGGVLLPTLLYTGLNLGGSGDVAGWAIPAATDIAFALAVLAIVGSHLPSALRTFLLTLAVVDDLLAITIIAIFYTRDLQLVPLLLALVTLSLFAVAVQRRVRSWWVLLPLAATTWGMVHASGVHATVAGILLGFAVPVVRQAAGTRTGLAEHFEHRWRPLSASVAVPVFAFFATGVAVGGVSGLASMMRDPVAIGIVVGLVVGKPVGVLGATWLVTRYTRASLDTSLSWWDLLGLAMLAGIGFTVSLLIGDLTFGAGSARDDHVKVAILTGSVIAATLASIVLHARSNAYGRLFATGVVDADQERTHDLSESDLEAR